MSAIMAMRVFVLAFALIAGAAAYPQCFKPGHRYIYELDGSVLSTMPDVAPQHVGMRIQARVIVERVENAVLLRLENATVGRAHDKLKTGDPERIPWKYSGIGELEKHLLQPIRAIYEYGKFKIIHVIQGESPMVTNMKKAIYSMLVVGVDPAKPSYNIESKPYGSSYYSRSLENSGNYLPKLDAGGSYINITEDGISGECETLYMIDSSPSAYNPMAEVYNITKLRNYDKCENQPKWIVTNHLAYECDDCEADNVHLLRTVTVVEQDLVKTGDSYVLEEVLCSSQTTFNPLSVDGDNFVTNHTQSLSLVSVKRIDRPMNFPNAYETHQSLQYQFPDVNKNYVSGPAALKQRPPSHGIPYKGDPIPRAKLSLEAMTRRTHSDDLSSLINATYDGSRLVFHMRAMKYDELTKVHSGSLDARVAAKSDEDKVKRSIFLHALKITGTGPSFMFIKHLVETQQVVGEEAIQLVMSIPKYILEPTPEIISELWTLTKNPVIVRDSQLWKTSLLAFGEMLFQACSGPENSPIRPLPPYLQTFCSQEMEQKYVSELGDMLRKATELPKKLLLIRVLGRTSLTQVVEMLKPIITGRRVEIEAVRRSAILALIRLSRYGSHIAVKRILEDVFYNTDEPTSVRAMALIALFKAQPEYSTLQQIAAWSWNEDSDHVQSLIYSLFDYHANSSHPCMLTLASYCKSLLPFVEEGEWGIQMGQFWEISDYDDDYGLGTQLIGSHVGSNSSMIPDAGKIALNMTAGSMSSQIFSVTYNSHNLQSVLDNYFGPIAAMNDVQRDTDIFKVNDKLNVKPRDQEEAFINLVITLMNSKSRMIYISKKDISDLTGIIPDLKGIDWKRGYPVNIVKWWIPLQTKYHMPLEMGLPLMLGVSIPVLVKVTGIIQWETELPTQEPWSSANAGILTLDLKISGAIVAKGRIGVIDVFDDKMMAAAVSFSTAAKAPVRVVIRTKLNEGKVQINVKPSVPNPVQRSHKLLIHKVQPVTMTSYIFADSTSPPLYKPVHSDPHPDKIEWNVGREKLGVPISLKIESERDFTDLGSYLDDLEDTSLLSLASFFWVSPEFKHHQVEVHFMQDSGVNTPEVEIDLRVKYTPTPSERWYLEGSHQKNVSGLWGYTAGWAQLPERCSSAKTYSSNYRRRDYESPIATPEPYDDYDTTIDPYNRFATYEPQFSSYDKKPYYQNSRASKVPREREVSKLDVDFKIHSPNPNGGGIFTKTILMRDFDDHKDILTTTIDLKRIPLVATDTFQICLKGETTYPEVPCDDAVLTEPNFEGTIQSTFRASWGGICPADPQITGEIRLEKSKEQREFETNSEAWYMDQCKEDLKEELQDSYACDLTRNEMTSFNKLVFDVKWKQIPPWLYNATRALEDYFKYKYYNHMTLNPIDVDNGESRLKITAKVHTEMPAVNIKIYKPHENTYFHKIWYGDTVPYAYTISADDSLLEQLVDDITGGMETPSCTISKKYIDMFDNITSEYELNGCFHVVAKDCTEKSLFTILMARESEDTNIVKMDLVGHNVTIIARSGSYDIIVDGQDMSLNPSEVIVLRSSTRAAGDKIIGYISQMGHELYVQCPGMAMAVVLDGKQVRTELSNFWRGKLCGLCGEFSGDTDDEFVGPRQCLYPDSISYGLSYALPSPRCTLPPPPNPNKICDDDVSPQSRYESEYAHPAPYRPVYGDEKPRFMKPSYETPGYKEQGYKLKYVPDEYE